MILFPHFIRHLVKKEQFIYTYFSLKKTYQIYLKKRVSFKNLKSTLLYTKIKF